MRRKQDDPNLESVKKKVRFNEAITLTPDNKSQLSKRSPKLFQSLPLHAEFGRLKRLIYSRLDQGQVDKLNRDLETYGVNNDMLVNFFKERGTGLLSKAIEIDKNINFLTFIFNKIPYTDIQVVLQKDKYSSLYNFLTLSSYLVENKLYTTEEKQLRIQKLIILLRLPTVKEFIFKNQDRLPLATQQEVEQATNKINSDQYEYTHPKL